MRIKILINTAIGFLAIAAVMYAQETKVKDIQTPPSPAFVLLGIEPSSISKPTIPRAVAANFITTVQQGGALEIAPYWLTSHPELKFEDYINADVGQTFLQTLSFSFASIPKAKAEDTLGTRVGLGARWLLFNGSPRQDTLKSLRTKLEDILAETFITVSDERKKELENERREVTLRIQKEEHERFGFSLSMASAATMNFLDDNFKKGKFDKWGVWLNAAYAIDPSFDFLAVARVIGNSKPEGIQNVFDFGARIVAAMEDLSLSCEYIQRIEINKERSANYINTASNSFFLKNTYRLTGNVEYKYNNDISVILTFGKDYSSEKNDNGSLIAQVGLNLGFGEIPFLHKE